MGSLVEHSTVHLGSIAHWLQMSFSSAVGYRCGGVRCFSNAAEASGLSAAPARPGHDTSLTAVDHRSGAGQDAASWFMFLVSAKTRDRLCRTTPPTLDRINLASCSTDRDGSPGRNLGFARSSSASSMHRAAGRRALSRLTRWATAMSLIRICRNGWRCSRSRSSSCSTILACRTSPGSIAGLGHWRHCHRPCRPGHLRGTVRRARRSSSTSRFQERRFGIAYDGTSNAIRSSEIGLKIDAACGHLPARRRSSPTRNLLDKEISNNTHRNERRADQVRDRRHSTRPRPEPSAREGAREILQEIVEANNAKASCDAGFVGFGASSLDFRGTSSIRR